MRLTRGLAPDVVLLDISMPVLDGIAAAEQIATLPTRTAVLMLTGSSAPHDVDRARRAGVPCLHHEAAARLVEAIREAAGV